MKIFKGTLGGGVGTQVLKYTKDLKQTPEAKLLAWYYRLPLQNRLDFFYDKIMDEHQLTPTPAHQILEGYLEMSNDKGVYITAEELEGYQDLAIAMIQDFETSFLFPMTTLREMKEEELIEQDIPEEQWEGILLEYMKTATDQAMKDEQINEQEQEYLLETLKTMLKRESLVGAHMKYGLAWMDFMKEANPRKCPFENSGWFSRLEDKSWEVAEEAHQMAKDMEMIYEHQNPRPNTSDFLKLAQHENAKKQYVQEIVMREIVYRTRAIGSKAADRGMESELRSWAEELD